MLNLLSIATLAGLFVLIYNGPGIVKIIKQGWAIGKAKEKQISNQMLSLKYRNNLFILVYEEFFKRDSSL